MQYRHLMYQNVFLIPYHCNKVTFSNVQFRTSRDGKIKKSLNVFFSERKFQFCPPNSIHMRFQRRIFHKIGAKILLRLDFTNCAYCTTKHEINLTFTFYITTDMYTRPEFCVIFKNTKLREKIF